MNILILGRTEILYETARQIIAEGTHQVTAIITAKAALESERNEEDFKALATSAGILFHQTQRLDDTAKAIVLQSQADICVSINWVSVIHRDFTELFQHGVINAHFGDLPRFRGNSASNWALVLGEKQAVLTIHQMEPSALDSGDILLQRSLPLMGDTTIADMNRFALTSCPSMFLEVLNGLAVGTLKPLPQAQTGLTPSRCYPRLPQDGNIDWTLPACKIHALIRSLTHPYPGSYTYYRDQDYRLQKLFIWESRIVCEHTEDIGIPGHVVRNCKESGESWIYTGDGILALCLCSHAVSDPHFRPGSRWKSIRLRLGMDVEEEIYRLVKQFANSND